MACEGLRPLQQRHFFAGSTAPHELNTAGNQQGLGSRQHAARCDSEADLSPGSTPSTAERLAYALAPFNPQVQWALLRVEGGTSSFLEELATAV